MITCRHEAAAANMAEAYGKLTGKPGVCFVTRGPGATHASIGVHTAFQDSTPLILFIGQVSRAHREREAFQEIDYRRFFAPLAKWATEAESASRLGEFVRQAYVTALQGRKGPVVIALPEDILEEETQADPVFPLRPAGPAPNPEALDVFKTELEGARAPLLLLGGSGWDGQAVKDVHQFAAAHDLPVVTAFRFKDVFDNTSPLYGGELGFGASPDLVRHVREADLLIAFGPRLGDVTTQGYTLFTPEETAEKLIHIHAGGEELGRVWPTRLSLQATPATMAAALRSVQLKTRWTSWRETVHRSYQAWREPVMVEGPVNLSEIFSWLSKNLPHDAIITNGAGNYAAWLHRFYEHKSFRTQLAPTSGAMGYGFPAALAAKLVHPECEVIAVAGDGCFMMAAQELATAVHYDLPVIIVLVNNNGYGTIRMHQERDYPRRVMATGLTNPDFVAYAESFGAYGACVRRTEDFAQAFDAARASQKPALIEIQTDMEQIAPTTTITALRQSA